MSYWPFPLRYDRVANFLGNLSLCLASGVELRKAVRTSAGGLAKTNPEFEDFFQRVEQGQSLTESLRALERRLPPFVFPVVECGERTGRLDESLRFLADHCRMLHKPREALQGAWLYPIAILVLGDVLRVVILLLFGGWSALIAAIGNLLTTLGSFAAIGILIWATPMKLLVDQVKLVVPFVASLERELAMHRFLHVFAMLYGGGGERVERMIRHATATVGNYWVRQDLLRVAAQVERGLRCRKRLPPRGI